MKDDIPPSVKKYFWGDDIKQLNWNSHKQYVIQTLLNKGDETSVSWLLKKAGSDQIKQMLPQLKLDPLSRNFWQVYLS